MPVLDEAGLIVSALTVLQGVRQDGHELIVVDGGSQDATAALAAALADRVIVSDPGRARQLNAGAAVAGGSVLLFLHADTRLPGSALRDIAQALPGDGQGWGYFRLRLSGRLPMLRIVETGINLRTRISGVATGDLAVFATRSLFDQVGGFPDIPLMEDVALSKRLRRAAWPHRLRATVISSSRRWEEQGVLRTVVLMWRLRLAFFMGADPHKLVADYYPQRDYPQDHAGKPS